MENDRQHNGDVLRAYWTEHYSDKGMCVLCGNSGMVDTRPTAISPIGVRVGKKTYCICPNGRSIQKSKGGERPLDWSK
jgi:hypothetical protein